MRVNSEITELVLSGSWAATCKCKTWHSASSQGESLCNSFTSLSAGEWAWPGRGLQQVRRNIFFPCEDLPRQAESFFWNNRKGKPWFLFVSLRACGTEGGRKSSCETKLGLWLLKVHMCWIHLPPCSYLAPCWVTAFPQPAAVASQPLFPHPHHLSWWIMHASAWQIKWRDLCVFCLSDELINLVSSFLLQLFFLLALLNGWGAGAHRGDVWCLVQIAPAFRVLLCRGSYGSSDGCGGVSLLVFTLWGLGLLRLLHKSQQKVKACQEDWQWAVIRSCRCNSQALVNF